MKLLREFGTYLINTKKSDSINAFIVFANTRKKYGKNDNEIEIIANDRYCGKNDFFRYNPIVFWNTQFGSSFVN